MRFANCEYCGKRICKDVYGQWEHSFSGKMYCEIQTATPEDY